MPVEAVAGRAPSATAEELAVVVEELIGLLADREKSQKRRISFVRQMHSRIEERTACPRVHDAPGASLRALRWWEGRMLWFAKRAN